MTGDTSGSPPAVVMVTINIPLPMATGSTHLHSLEVAEEVVKLVEIKKFAIRLFVCEMDQIWVGRAGVM